MSTVGTLYNETVGGGFAKLLTTTNISNGVNLVGFTLPAAYDAFLFDLESIYTAGGNPSLIIRVSADNGASWIASGYYWSMSTVFSYNNNSWNPYGSASLGDPHPTWIGWSHGIIDGHPLCGRVRFFQYPGNLSTVLFRYSSLQPSYYTTCNVGAGWYTLLTPLNAIAFITYGGTFTGGAIRMYGMRNGT